MYTEDTVREVLAVLGLDYEKGDIVSVVLDAGKIAVTTEVWPPKGGEPVVSYTTTTHFYHGTLVPEDVQKPTPADWS